MVHAACAPELDLRLSGQNIATLNLLLHQLHRGIDLVIADLFA